MIGKEDINVDTLSSGAGTLSGHVFTANTVVSNALLAGKAARMLTSEEITKELEMCC